VRDVTKLHPVLQEKIAIWKSKCLSRGLKVGISECLRTAAEQDALYAKGRTAPGHIVTNARGSTNSSMHMWGVAFDFYRNDGKGAYYDNDGFFAKVGAVGKEVGLEWGGSWVSIKDTPHFQLPNWGSTTARIKRIYGTPAKFMATWKKVTPAIVQVAASKSAPKTIKREDIEVTQIVYKHLVDIPNVSGFRDIIGKMMTAGLINGDGSDKAGNGDIINLTYDQVRNYVVGYRGGAYDRKFISLKMEPAIKI